MSSVSPIIPSNVSRYLGQLIGVIRVIGVIGAISDNWIDNTVWYHYLSCTESGYLLTYLSKERGCVIKEAVANKEKIDIGLPLFRGNSTIKDVASCPD